MNPERVAISVIFKLVLVNKFQTGIHMILFNAVSEIFFKVVSKVISAIIKIAYIAFTAINQFLIF